jgi:membrane-bound lytic murein transglycosylase D
VSTFIDNEDSIYNYRTDELLKNRSVVAVGTQSGSKGKASTGRARYHTVRSGETLGRIASKYHVSVKQLQRWNGLSGTKISAGKRLKISN